MLKACGTTLINLSGIMPRQSIRKANDAFSETIDVLNEVEKLVGRQNNPSPTSLARSARSALSNAQKSERTLEMLNSLDELAAKHGTEFPDDIKTQMSVVQTIEKLFPSAKPPASFGGEIDKSLSAARRAAGQDIHATVIDSAMGLAKKAFGKTDAKRQDEMLAALRELIATSQQ